MEAFTKYVSSKPLRSVVSAGDCLLVRKVFDSFDADGSNAMSLDSEMENCVVKILGLPLESPRVRRVLNLARKTAGPGADSIDFIGFFDVLVDGNVLSESRVMAITNLFRLMDFDRSGTLIMPEVKSALYAAGPIVYSHHHQSYAPQLVHCFKGASHHPIPIADRIKRVVTSVQSLEWSEYVTCE